MFSTDRVCDQKRSGPPSQRDVLNDVEILCKAPNSRKHIHNRIAHRPKPESNENFRLRLFLLPLGLITPLVQPGVNKKALANKTSMLQSRWFGNRITKEEGGFMRMKNEGSIRQISVTGANIIRYLYQSPPESNIQGGAQRYRRNHRGRGLPRPHSSPGEYPTVHEYSTVRRDAQGQKRTDDLRQTRKFKV